MPREVKGVSKRKSGTDNPYKLFVIASEGADTERIYFEAFGYQIMRNLALSSKVKIEFLKRDEKQRTYSSHQKVIKQLDNYKRNYHLANDDELWLVIDRDKQNNPIANISAIAQSCSQKGYKLALSNPNFEFWLLLHLNYLCNYKEAELNDFLQAKKVNKNKNALEKELSKLLNGYDKSHYKVESILQFIPFAILQAKKLDTNPIERWQEEDLGSRIYLLMERILQEKEA